MISARRAMAMAQMFAIGQAGRPIAAQRRIMLKCMRVVRTMYGPTGIGQDFGARSIVPLDQIDRSVWGLIMFERWGGPIGVSLFLLVFVWAAGGIVTSASAEPGDKLIRGSSTR